MTTRVGAVARVIRTRKELLKRREIKKGMKMRVYCNGVTTTLLYGCKIWTNDEET